MGRDRRRRDSNAGRDGGATGTHSVVFLFFFLYSPFFFFSLFFFSDYLQYNNRRDGAGRDGTGAGRDVNDAGATATWDWTGGDRYVFCYFFDLLSLLSSFLLLTVLLLLFFCIALTPCQHMFSARGTRRVGGCPLAAGQGGTG